MITTKMLGLTLLSILTANNLSAMYPAGTATVIFHRAVTAPASGINRTTTDLSDNSEHFHVPTSAGTLVTKPATKITAEQLHILRLQTSARSPFSSATNDYYTQMTKEKAQELHASLAPHATAFCVEPAGRHCSHLIGVVALETMGNGATAQLNLEFNPCCAGKTLHKEMITHALDQAQAQGITQVITYVSPADKVHLDILEQEFGFVDRGAHQDTVWTPATNGVFEVPCENRVLIKTIAAAPVAHDDAPDAEQKPDVQKTIVDVE